VEPPRWSEGASEWAHEREALAFVRGRLPDHSPWRAWSNVEFLAEDGSVNEVDLLVVSPRGLFLIEIKSWPGKIFGDGQQWRHQWPDGRTRPMEHPLILANRKAKRLRSLLVRQRAMVGSGPWVQALVFLSSAALESRLHEVGRIGVSGRDPDPLPAGVPPAVGGTGGFSLLPGIVATLKDPALVGMRPGAVNRPLSDRIAEALAQAGLRTSDRGKRVGDWDLGTLLDEGPGWQDFGATRSGMGVGRRVRVYLAGVATSKEEEARLREEAAREFKVMAGIIHDGIARPLDLVQSERGPALLFDRIEGEIRLDLWAPATIRDLDVAERVQLLRQLVEAVAHAHAQKVTHRALTSRAVLAGPGPEGGRLVIGHWQSASRDLATQLTAHQSADPELGSELAERLSSDEQVYLAPETFTAEKPDGVALDVFSLGALAVLLLSGQPPAADLAERERQFDDYGGLSLDAAVDHMPEGLAELVATATDPLPERRPALREMLEMLDSVLDTLTAPPPATEDDGPVATEDGVDPLQASRGDRLESGWEVLRRLGSGSTAVALLCTRPGLAGPQVLKVARDEDHSERLRDEERVLRELHHPCIVELAGLDRVGGRTTLRLSPAGDPGDKVGMTLADRLTQQGRIGLDLLERFGDDLFDALVYLESEGVLHRDIKPDNLGVRPRRGDRSLRLVLFDFSLTRTPDSNLQAGTAGYLDPFLVERPTRRYDAGADRYAAAVTLYEMTTGTRPQWGDGRTDPVRLADTTPAIDTALLDPSVRDAMAAFFATALARDVTDRYDTADRMRQAWRAVFVAPPRPATNPGVDGAEASDLTRAELVSGAIRSTPVGELGLSGAAVAALERLGVSTAGQLAEFSSVEWNRAPGVGLQARRDAADMFVLLRDHFGSETPDPAASIDRMAGQLIPKPTTGQAAADQVGLRALLGLAPMEPASDDEVAGTTVPWPGPAEVGAASGLSRVAYDELLGRARERWRRQASLTAVRQDIEGILARSGGILSADDLVLALLAQRGSTASGAARRARGRAVLRAALETESSLLTERFTWRRVGGGAAAVVAARSDDLDGEELADYAASLGRVADGLAGEEQPSSPLAAVDRLRKVPPPVGLAPLSDHRLVRLAVAASATAAVSSRLEVYPRRLSPSRAVRLARSALLSPYPLGEAEVRNRVKTRFPDAQDLPARPDLNGLLRDIVGLEWSPAGLDPRGVPRQAGFIVPPPPSPGAPTGTGGSGTRFRTGTSVAERDEDRMEAELIHERLERSARNGGYLAMTVPPSQHNRAVRQLGDLGAEVIDLDAEIIGAIRAFASERGIDWDRAIVTADAAGPSGPRWASPLLSVIREALAPLTERLLTGAAHQLLVHPGLLARYDRLGLVDEMREAVTRQPRPGQTLRTLWLLVPALDPNALVSIDGAAVAVTTPAERLALSPAWTQNLHRTRPSGTPA
jgi:serine/threonine protein kinase